MADCIVAKLCLRPSTPTRKDQKPTETPTGLQAIRGVDDGVLLAVLEAERAERLRAAPGRAAQVEEGGVAGGEPLVVAGLAGDGRLDEAGVCRARQEA